MRNGPFMYETRLRKLNFVKSGYFDKPEGPKYLILILILCTVFYLVFDNALLLLQTGLIILKISQNEKKWTFEKFKFHIFRDTVSKFQKNFYDQGTKTIKLFQVTIIGTVCLTLSHSRLQIESAARLPQLRKYKQISNHGKIFKGKIPPTINYVNLIHIALRTKRMICRNFCVNS